MKQRFMQGGGGARLRGSRADIHPTCSQGEEEREDWQKYREREAGDFTGARERENILRGLLR